MSPLEALLCSAKGLHDGSRDKRRDRDTIRGPILQNSWWRIMALLQQRMLRFSPLQPCSNNLKGNKNHKMISYIKHNHLFSPPSVNLNHSLRDTRIDDSRSALRSNQVRILTSLLSQTRLQAIQGHRKAWRF